MSESSMGEGGGSVAMPERKKPRAPRRAKPKAKPVQGRKTLIAATAGALIALADLWMTVKLGVKLF